MHNSFELLCDLNLTLDEKPLSSHMKQQTFFCSGSAKLKVGAVVSKYTTKGTSPLALKLSW